jgi:hypothetical protein
LIVFLGGFAAGLVHVASGPDHWAAVAPLAADPRRIVPAWRVGAAWGLGHGVAVAAVAALGQAARASLGFEGLAAWAERSIGLLLIGLGLWTIARAGRLVLHRHEHRHDEAPAHTHLHVHSQRHLEEHRARAGHLHGVAALGIGVVHGLAGASHWIAAAPTLAMSGWPVLHYLLGYLAAAILAMATFAALLATLAGRLGPFGVRSLLRAIGGLAISIGVVWLFLAS